METKKIDWRSEWKELRDSLPTARNIAQSALSFIWFIQDIPRVIKLLPGVNREIWIPGVTTLGTSLKPYEVIAQQIKGIATVFELPDKWASLRWCELKKEKSHLKRVHTILSGIQLNMDGLLIIPGGWRWLDLGRWSGAIGRMSGIQWLFRTPLTQFGLERIRDGFTIAASVCNVVHTRRERDVALACIGKCRQRLNGPLVELRGLLEEGSENFREIGRLKAVYANGRVKSSLEAPIEELKKRQLKLSKELAGSHWKMAEISKELQKIEGELHLLREKRERRIVWSQPIERERLRQVVVYKMSKNAVRMANAEMVKEKVTAVRRYEISKIAVLCFVNLLELSLAAFVAPVIGVSIGTVAGLFVLGKWVTSLTTGITNVQKIAAGFRYSPALPYPQTHLLRV